MADINSKSSLDALKELKDKDPAFAGKCQGKSVREQNLLAATKEVIDVAEANLKAIGEDYLASVLMIGMMDKGGGVRQLLDNVAAILDSLPADENKRAEVTEILDDMVEGILRTTGQLSGELSQRMGNEIMIDPADLV